MNRKRSTDKSNHSFNAAIIEAVWQKANIVPGKNPNLIRRDECGTIIVRNEYGNTNSPNGWEVDHIKPVSRGGSDSLSNLQPLQWENNRSKGDDYPRWFCAA